MCVCVYILSSGGLLNMVKISQDHFQAILLRIFHFLAMLNYPPQLNMEIFFQHMVLDRTLVVFTISLYGSFLGHFEHF